MPEYGPGLSKLKELLELDDAEVAALAVGYSDAELSGPVEFIMTLSSKTTTPHIASRFSAKAAAKLQREIKKLLREVRTVLLAGGPRALGRYLDMHPFRRYLN